MMVEITALGSNILLCHDGEKINSEKTPEIVFYTLILLIFLRLIFYSLDCAIWNEKYQKS